VARLRSLLALGGTIESHALHLFCLVAPDYLGFSGVLEMQEFRPDVAQALELKLLGHVIQERIGGRAVHPVNMLIGGVSRWPAPDTFAELRDAAAAGLRTLRRLEPLVTQLRTEELHPTPRTAVALTRDAEGQLLGLGRELLATGHPPRPVAEFRQHVNERVVRHSTAKQALYSRAPFMVGALARLLHHGPTLGGEGGQALVRLCPEGLVPDPRLNNLAQLVELYHCCEEVMRLCTILGDAPPEPPPPLEPPAPGVAVTGTAAIEAPRGTLFHAYQLDAGGQVLDADIITPTAQNLAQVELDLGGIVDRWLTEQQPGGDAGLHGELEQLVRAYDPCISCSTHLVNLERQA
jgi:sulfhydrogenase subunit alpha